ncbi:hypothetical protein BMAJHU_I0430 [Burkholderia mallei JHU]|nr:hypothetical protein BMAJHU_I0430 [Burkholderia mallei JHU]
MRAIGFGFRSSQSVGDRYVESAATIACRDSKNAFCACLISSPVLAKPCLCTSVAAYRSMIH